jgi:hypothetical protein
MNAQSLNIKYPWDDHDALNTWKEIWQGKDIADGQTPSQMFLWSLLSAEYQEVDDIIEHEHEWRRLKRRRAPSKIDEVLDIYCAQLQYQDRNPSEPCLLMNLEEMRDKFFPHFRDFIHIVWSMQAPHLGIQK